MSRCTVMPVDPFRCGEHRLAAGCSLVPPCCLGTTGWQSNFGNYTVEFGAPEESAMRDLKFCSLALKNLPQRNQDTKGTCSEGNSHSDRFFEIVASVTREKLEPPASGFALRAWGSAFSFRLRSSSLGLRAKRHDPTRRRDKTTQQVGLLGLRSASYDPTRPTPHDGPTSR